MNPKVLLIIIVVLFLVFVGIWIVSPRVGEKVDIDDGVDVTFEEVDYDLPTSLPDGFVRVKEISEAVVYRFQNKDKIIYYEHIGNDEFTFYDINKPSFLVRTSFNKKIFQIKEKNGVLRNEYRMFDGTRWRIVSRNEQEVFTLPNNYTLMPTEINLYVIDNNNKYSYKLLTMLSEDKYAWLSPTDVDTWIETDIPDNFKKTKILNVYQGTIDKKTVYKKVLSFPDKNKTIAVVSCDKNGKFI